MNTLKPASAVVWEESGFICLARVLGNAGTAITQASISSINRKVFNRATGVEISSTALTVSAVVFDTLQTGDIWSEDSTGYNFSDGPAAADFSDANQTYRIEYTFTPASGQIFRSVFEVRTKDILGA